MPSPRRAFAHRIFVLLLIAFVTGIVGCEHKDAPVQASKADLTAANAQIAQPAWLGERLPEHTAAYARIPSLWGTLSAPDGRPLDSALASAEHVKIIASLRKAVHTDPLIAQTGAGPILELLLGDQGAPLEIAVIDASDGVSPASRALATTVLDVPDIAVLNARVAALSGPNSPLQAPFDANGDATLKQNGALHFDTQTHRLYVSFGTTASALTLQQDLAQLKARRAHPMQDAEREIDSSGQGLFVWMSAKGLNNALAAQLPPQLQPDGLLRDAILHAQSIALGWGTVDGHGRLQLQIRAPQSRLLGYLAPNAGDVDLKTSGKPGWAITMALPGAENLQAMRDGLDRDYAPGLHAQFDNGLAQVQAKTGIDPVEFAKFVGPQLVAFGDANGTYVALCVRDRKALYAKLDVLGKRFNWQSSVVKSGDLEIHHLHIPGFDATTSQPGMDPKARAWMQLYARIGSHFYWVEDGDYLVFASVPQLLVDRVAAKPDTSLGQWLHDQSYSSAHTVLGVAATNHNMQREVYYTYLGALQALGDALGQSIDLTTLPSAGQLKLPVDGAIGFAVEATDQRVALQMTYEQTPIEGLVGGGGTSSMTAVAVVAILAAISIPAYQDYVIRSQVSEGAALSEGAKTAVAEYYANQGRMPHDNAAAGVAEATSIAGAYVSRVQIVDGQIRAIYSSHTPQKANAALDGGALEFSPAPENGAIHWTCGSTNIPQKYLPTVCRH